MAVLTYVKNVRTSQNRQQKDMAAAIGTCPRTISNIEKGQYCPSLETALRIAKYLKVPVENLFELDESMEYGARIENILKDIMKNNPEKGE